MARVYVETSFFSALASTREDVASRYRQQASIEWWATQRRAHELIISTEVIEELSHPDFRNREAALAFTTDVLTIPVDEETRRIASAFVVQMVMPGPVVGDAVHVAAACAASCDYLLSWNVRHLANRNKVAHLAKVCLSLGLTAPTILTPDLLWDRE